MSAQTVAVIIGELMAAGVNVRAILQDAKDNGRVSDEVWEQIRAEIERANARWEAAGK